MDEPLNSTAMIMMLTLFIGGICAFWIVRRLHIQHPVDIAQHITQITARAVSAKQFGILSFIILLLYFLAGCSGQFFYEEQIPLMRLVAQWVIYAAFAIALLLLNRPRINRFGLSLKKIKWLPAGFGFYFAAVPLLMATSLAYRLILNLFTGSELELQEVAQHVRGNWTWLQIGYVLTAVLGAPIYEEIIFRGILFPFILKRSNVKVALIFTAVLFAAIHLHIPSLAPIALLSVVLCIAYVRTASLWACIGIHMMFNAIGIFALNITG